MGEMVRMLKPKDIQEHLGIGKNKCYQLISLKSFPKIRVGNTYIIPEDKYLEWIDKNLKKKIII